MVMKVIREHFDKNEYKIRDVIDEDRKKEIDKLCQDLRVRISQEQSTTNDQLTINKLTQNLDYWSTFLAHFKRERNPDSQN